MEKDIISLLTELNTDPLTLLEIKEFLFTYSLIDLEHCVDQLVEAGIISCKLLIDEDEDNNHLCSQIHPSGWIYCYRLTH